MKLFCELKAFDYFRLAKKWFWRKNQSTDCKTIIWGIAQHHSVLFSKKIDFRFWALVRIFCCPLSTSTFESIIKSISSHSFLFKWRFRRLNCLSANWEVAILRLVFLHQMCYYEFICELQNKKLVRNWDLVSKTANVIKNNFLTLSSTYFINRICNLIARLVYQKTIWPWLPWHSKNMLIEIAKINAFRTPWCFQ